MFIIYDLFFLLITLFYLPVYLLKGKLHSGLISRLGILPAKLDLAQPIWVHAVSVGEAMAVRGLIEQLRIIYPNKKLVISTVTSTGNKIAKSMIKDGDLLIYLPLDISFIVRRVINRINPAALIIVETEIWPNLISSLYKKNIPVVVVNARISDASFRGYSAIKFIIQNILRKVSLFCSQTESDAQRLISLGVARERIRITGNMKFDQTPQVRVGDYRARLGLRADEKLFVAGSTHPGEEALVLNTYKELLLEFPGIRLLLAPRHPERAKEVADLVARLGLAAARTSELTSQQSLFPEKPVFILDTVGELVSCYASCDIVFVGGSLIKRGGQNILEPASVGKPVIFGMYMYNFRDIVRMFLEKEAAIMVHNQQELNSALVSLLKDAQLIEKLTKNAKEIIARNQGATLRNIKEIKSVI